MGRRERPIDPRVSGPLAEFADGLRQLRGQAGLSYRELAQHAHYSASVLSEAASGMSRPSLEVTLAYVRGCGGTEQELKQWAQAWQLLNEQFTTKSELQPPRVRAAILRRSPRQVQMRIPATGAKSATPISLPDPRTATTIPEFTAQLRLLRERLGLSYAQLAERTLSDYPLSKSTIHAMLTSNRLPQPGHLRAVINACGQEDHLDAWLGTLHKLLAQTYAAEVASPQESAEASPADGPTPASTSDDAGNQVSSSSSWTKSHFAILAVVATVVFVLGWLAGMLMTQL
ncbi:helix-turn-helix transcriptional regulator [Amycolatopsis sp. NPDC004625]|uniref:helix-turn-helix domain-containing protein n=1 Tax=Amycolatopsis sp. NPDC004625 TaxID=3154670 RepID=UPI0033A074A0